MPRGPYAYRVSISAAIRRQHERIAPPELRDYPWWLATGVMFGSSAVVIGAMIQRQGFTSFGWTTVAGLIAVGDMVLTLALGRLMPPWFVIATTAGAVAIWLSHPVAADIAPMLFTFSAAKLTVTSGVRWGGFATLVYVGVLVVAASIGTVGGIVLFVFAAVLGFDVGYTFRFQNRVIGAERARVEAERDRAAISERQRIAREIHDLVAHSMSVTMLHVTGARHALSSDGDVDEAISALREAEQVGRQAMTDIRRTVGVLSSAERPSMAPLPGVQDIDNLVETMRAAGLDVGSETCGDINAVPASLGLGLYRITQESLSNIAKHAPQARASVRLEVLADGAHLQVRNAVRAGAVFGAGAGLPGMAERAKQLGGELTARAEDGEWRVELIVPAAEQARHACLFGRLLGEGA